MDLPIIEPIETYEKTFNTPDEFNIFYAKNKDAIDAKTTHILNRTYLIKGYRITKIKGVLSLKKYNPETNKYYVSKKDREDAKNNEIQQLRNELQSIDAEHTRTINEMKEKISVIMESVNKIIRYLSPNEDE